MSDFVKFKSAVQKQFTKMSQGELFVTGAGKDELWDMYLGSFPEGTNPIFRERTEHDCQCCKQFIRAGANVVSLVDNKTVSIWDITIGGYYQIVADALSALVKSKPIVNVFRHYEPNLGTNFNHQQLDSGDILRWDHFHYALPRQFTMPKDAIATKLAEFKSNQEVLKRGLTEITIEALETVIELIDQNSLYRGAENKQAVVKFLEVKRVFQMMDDAHKETYCWKTSLKVKGLSKLRNTSMGTLLVDLSEDMPLDQAVRKFTAIVAPANYKRPTALITKGMIKKAQEEVQALGIEDSLSRRYAVTDDITINNVLFANREVKQSMNVFDDLAKDVKTDVKHLDKVEEVDVSTFMHTILPKAESIELLLENKHSNNLMSLIAPVNNDAKHMFKWDNNFSWAYAGEVADSIKERVKRAGGNVTGVFRCSLSWFNYDDLDIHIVEPNGNHIHYGNKSGKLDVDMNAGGHRSRSPVENITWQTKASILQGTYKLRVKNYSKRESVNVGFDMEMEFDGTIYSFHYPKAVANGETIQVARFNYSKTKGIEITESLPSTQASKEVWGLPTQQFHKVSMIMNSPNHWDGHKTGNKHWFFILDKCHNDSNARGFFNEFLKAGLNKHRKVFEVLGSKMKVEKSDDQLSGLGFSSTQKNQVVCKVTGSFARTIKINF